jgi:hypothetical protein
MEGEQAKLIIGNTTLVVGNFRANVEMPALKWQRGDVEQFTIPQADDLPRLDLAGDVVEVRYDTPEYKRRLATRCKRAWRVLRGLE